MFDPAVHRVALDVTPSAEIREALKEVGVEVLGVKDSGAYIGLVTDAARRLLVAFESLKVSVRLEQLQAKPVKINGAETLPVIHRHLFQDVYSWAGSIRTVEISKGGKPFFPLSHFRNAFLHIDTLIAQYRQVDKNDQELLALEKKLTLHLNPPDNANIYERYMSGTINGDVEQLTELILEIIKE